MAQARQVRLPNMLRNPVVAEQVAGELAEWAEEVENRAAAEGKVLRERGRVRMLRAVSRQLTEAANARIGTQADAEVDG